MSSRKRMKFLLCFLFAAIVFWAVLPNRRHTAMTSCIFCDIANGRMPGTVIEVETDDYVIFKDIKPASTYHYLAVPKQHIESLKALPKQNETLIVKMENGLREFYKQKGIDTTDALFGFHLPPFISVKHLHMHGIAPQSTMKFFNRFMFKQGSLWFVTVDEARTYLRKKSS